MNSRAGVTPCPGSGVSEHDWRVRKFCSARSVVWIRAGSTFWMMDLIAGSVALPFWPFEAVARNRVPAKTIPIVKIRFIDHLLAGIAGLRKRSAGVGYFGKFARRVVLEHLVGNGPSKKGAKRKRGCWKTL